MPRRIFEKEGIKWVNVSRPTLEDIEFIKTLFNFHPLVIESIMTPTLHPAIENYQDHLSLVLHFPVIHRNHAANIAVEVDFLVTSSLLITITYRSYARLEEFFERIGQDENLQRRLINSNSGRLLYGIIDWLLSSLIGDLDFLEEEVTKIEDRIFATQEPTLLEEISHTRRDILDFRRITSPLQTVLKLLPDAAATFFGKGMRPYFTNLITSESKIRHLIENHKDTIEVLHQTYESLLSKRISKIITLLTIFSAIILPLNFLASIWGMNQKFLPLRDGRYDFWVVIGAMIVIAGFLIFFFRRKKWL